MPSTLPSELHTVSVVALIISCRHCMDRRIQLLFYFESLPVEGKRRADEIPMEGRATICVGDSGPGMSAETIREFATFSFSREARGLAAVGAEDRALSLLRCFHGLSTGRERG